MSLREYRLQTAAGLLRSTDLFVGEVAQRRQRIGKILGLQE